MTFTHLLFAAIIGFNHAFEADHVLAVGNIANKRQRLWPAIRDGIFWGLGHTSTLFLVGCLIILGKLVLSMPNFAFFEALVGLSMVILGIFRLVGIRQESTKATAGPKTGHQLAYGIGLLHGLAGSGAVMVVAMASIQTSWQGIAYLVLFGLGSIIGMMLVAGLFNLPFTRQAVAQKYKRLLMGLSAIGCIGYGVWLSVESLS